MIETEGSRSTQNPGYGNDPFFGGSDGFDSGGLDDFDNGDLFGMLTEEQQNLSGFEGLDDLQLTTEAYLSSIPNDPKGDPFLSPAISTSSDGQHSTSNTTTSGTQRSSSPGADLPPPPSPVVIDPNEIDKISIQLEKNQQCRCKSCNKLFNSVWYLKQHAVKHSNDRPFKCKFCLKTYKFRSNLYQHKCPERNRQLGGPGGLRKRFYARGVAYTEVKHQNPVTSENPGQQKDFNQNSVPVLGSTLSEPLTESEYSSRIEETQTVQFDLIPVETPQMESVKKEEAPVVEMRPPRPPNSIRERPLDPAYIEEYLQRNKHKLFTCKKCKLQFPTKEHLNRHMTGHTLSEYYCYLCPQCPQKFCEERRLRSHLELHSKDPTISHKCRSCDGGFRSALALRRHRDQCRSCYSYPFGFEPQLMISPMQPLDPYGFIESDDENEARRTQFGHQKSSVDSGVGSDNSYVASPLRARFALEEELDEEKSPEDGIFTIPRKRTKKSSENEDADSGFRSRLNSTQSCSPGSTSVLSSGSDSPGRKFSNSGEFAQPGTSSYSTSGFPSGCGPQHRSPNMVSAPVVNYSYGLLEIDTDSDDYIEFASGEGLLVRKVDVLRKQSRILKPEKLPELTFGVDDSGIGSLTDLHIDGDDGPYRDLSFDPEPSIEVLDGKLVKACLAVFLNALIETAKAHSKI